MVRRSRDYFIQGGDLFLFADNCLFRIHRYFFTRESLYFQKELGHPAAPIREDVGTSANPYPLEGVTVHELERLLWVFYNPQYDLYDATVDDWATILELAREERWDFPRVRDLAIRKLNQLEMSDVDRIVLYQSCKVDKVHMVPCLTSLCKRDEPLTVEEGEKLSISTAMTIARAREVLRSPTTPTTLSSPIEETEELIRQAFQIKGKKKQVE